MVDLEPFLEAPFESASNVSFELVLFSGCILFTVVAFVGRSTATTALVSLYLLAIPAYVAFRIRVWEDEIEGEDADADENERKEPEAEGATADRDEEADEDGQEDG